MVKKKEIIFTISKKLTRNKIFELGNFSLSNKKSKNKLGWQNGTSLNKGLDLIFQKEILND